MPAFIPAYESALLINDLITAIMLFGQFGILRSRALLVLAGGYLFSGLMAVPHALTFPGVFSPAGLLGAGPQTAAWLYISWHMIFPLVVITYALHRQNHGDVAAMLSGRAAIIGTTITVVCVVTGLTLGTVLAEAALPPILIGIHYTPTAIFSLVFTGALSLLALVALWRRRPHSLLDLWLMVVMCAWLFDVGLSAVLNNGRYDLGFYAGRIYVLLGASFVLAVMLVETTRLYTRLAAAAVQLRARAGDLNRRVRERTDELARANRQLNAILEAAPLSIFMLDPTGNVLLWTASAERLFGYTAEEAVGGPPPYLGDNELAVWRGAFARTVAEASSGFNQTPRRRRDGTMIDVSVTWAPVHDEDGALFGVMYAIADITERKKLESQLQQAQKMEAIGNLTGGMAHDFNNLLGVIIGNLDLLRELRKDDDEVDELAREAHDAAFRGADLTRRLLAFARQQPLQAERVNVNELVSGITKLLSRVLGEHIEISLELSADVWPCIVDPVQLESSLTNLATNARDAMPRGGRLVIATANRDLDADYAALHSEVTPGDYVMIVVSDTGTGMPPEVLDRVFEPFYTTKERGKGTGLGLSMVFGFLKQSGGHLNVYSEVGTGTTFRLYLPRIAEEVASAKEAPLVHLVGGHGETVLAVEDNPALRRVVVRQLSELGYRVLEAENAGAAVAVMERQSVDLLLTDIVMPGGTDGVQLALDAQRRWPKVRVVFTSGFPETSHNGGAGLPAPGARLLSKPYRREDLASALRAALDVRPSR
ncbi:MAG: MASE4 domain-containing protein [Stellaceae bacterium]